MSSQKAPARNRNAARIFAVFAVACATQLHAQPVGEFSLETVERLGRAIYERDMAAWRATDVLRHENKAGRVADSEMSKILGWIVVGTPEEPVVKFIAEGPQGPYSVFAAASFRDKRRAIASEPPPKRVLTEAELTQFRARQLAIAQIKRRCSDTYNTVVLPNVEGDGFLVYALAATALPDVMVLGGHYRIAVSQDGRRIARTEALFRTCLTASLKPSMVGEMQKDVIVTREAVVVVHDVSRAPLETHVFLSLLHNRNIGVATGPQTVWIVSQGKIRRP